MSDQMTHEQREAFLHLVQEMVRKEPSLLPQIIARATAGLEKRVYESNQQRYQAENALLSVYDMIPKAKLEASPAVAVRVKKVLAESGAFCGTSFANDLASEIMEDEDKLLAKEAAEKEQSKEERARYFQKNRENRERVRQKKKPVSLIKANDVAQAVYEGKATLTPMRIGSGKDMWNTHAWVIVVNDTNPSQSQESSHVYVGKNPEGREVFGDEAETRKRIRAIVDLGALG